MENTSQTTELPVTIPDQLQKAVDTGDVSTIRSILNQHHKLCSEYMQTNHTKILQKLNYDFMPFIHFRQNKWIDKLFSQNVLQIISHVCFDGPNIKSDVPVYEYINELCNLIDVFKVIPGRIVSYLLSYMHNDRYYDCHLDCRRGYSSYPYSPGYLDDLILALVTRYDINQTDSNYIPGMITGRLNKTLIVYVADNIAQLNDDNISEILMYCFKDNNYDLFCVLCNHDIVNVLTKCQKMKPYTCHEMIECNAELTTAINFISQYYISKLGRTTKRAM